MNAFVSPFQIRHGDGIGLSSPHDLTDSTVVFHSLNLSIQIFYRFDVDSR